MTDMNRPARPTTYDKKVGLVLQGGGALGSYQAGVYEALVSSEYLPDWVAGISIGAINAAIIAGNAPEHRDTTCGMRSTNCTNCCRLTHREYRTGQATL